MNQVILDEKERLNEVVAIQSLLAAADFDLENFMNSVVAEMQKLTPATGVVIELVEGEEMVYRATTGSVATYLGLRLPKAGSISGLCVKSNKVLYSEDTETDPRVNLEACRKISIRSLVVAPLFSRGKAVGVLKIVSNTPKAFGETDVKILQIMAGFLGTALMNQLIQEVKKFY